MYRVDQSIQVTEDWVSLQNDARNVVKALLPCWTSLPSDQIQANGLIDVFVHRSAVIVRFACV